MRPAQSKPPRKKTPPPPAAGRASRGRRQPVSALEWLLATGIILATVAAYANSFAAPFIFDDVRSIPENPNIRSLWPVWKAAWAPPDRAVSGRPVVGLSLALNYAAGGLEVRGYHAFNLAVHILNALLIFLILKRSFECRGRPDGRVIDPVWLAGSIALLWALHPLNSEAVTYIIQRTELLMAFFLLLTLYAVMRGSETAPGRGWYAAAIASCALGMGSKEVMAVAPVVVFLYDRLFLAASFRQILRDRGWLYAGLAATWGILAALIATGPRTRSVGFDFAAVKPLEYLWTQSGVILHYLKLVFWPHPLSIDYADWPIASSAAAVIPELAAILGMIGLSVWALIRKPCLGFPAACFFIILAPSSSFIPIASEIAAERRMYLPLLAALLVAVPGLLVSMKSRLKGVPQALIVAPLLAAAGAGAWGTALRNEAFASEISIWGDVVARHPQNAKAQNNLGSALGRQGRVEEAVACFSKACALNPNYPEAFANLGAALYLQRRMDGALSNLREALRLRPDYLEAHFNLALTLHYLGRLDEAVGHYRKALDLNPVDPDAHNHMGAALLSLGRREEAILQFREAIRLNPGHAEARQNLERAGPGR